MAEPSHRLATYADLEAVPEPMVAEIIEGVLETHPRPHPRHGAISHNLSFEVEGPFGRGRGGPGGWIFVTEPELHLGSDVVVPDLAGWRRERLPSEPVEPYITIAPDWVCDILSPSTGRVDRGPKRRAYAKAGVRYLWLLDPSAGILEAFGLAGEQWLLLATIERGEAVSVAPFDATSFAFDDLFPFDEPTSPPASEA